MTEQVDFDADVGIVGAGPVGLTIANYLGMYGIRVVVLDGRESLIDYPRGVGMDDESLRTFQAIGVVDQVLPHTTPNQWLRFMNSKGRCFASIEPRAVPFGWSRRNAFIQPLVDKALLAGLDRFDHVDVRWNAECVGLDQDGSGVTVNLRDASGGDLAPVRVRYLVGSDGGRSFVRKSIDVSWDGTSNPTRWLVVDLENDPVGTPNAYVYGNWRRPYVSIALPHGLRRFEFMILPGEDEATMSTPEQVDELLRGVVPGIGKVDYIRQRVYTHHARVAGSFVVGRVAIAGDAAHLMPVWQGQGYNSGIRDAANLGWKLAMVVTGQAAPAILESYDTERRGHAAAMVKISQTAGILVRQTNRYSAGLRDAITRLWDYVPPFKRYIVEMRYKPMPRYTDGVIVGGGAPNAPAALGRLFIQPRVTTRQGASMLLDDVLGPWFAVVAWGHDPRPHLPPESMKELEALNATIVVVRPSTQLKWTDGHDESDDTDHDRIVVVGDESGALKTWFDDQGSSIVVVRPDRFVAALARPLDLAEQISRLSSLLRGPSTVTA
ncbi:MAG TPA: bifunctional 3-(3-hydroxy-phenyl)propionate/3-hydroxycinnamic acid hydroxylase [Ilumatobacteraceae bacterium]